MNEQLLALLGIDKELSVEEKLAALEEKQYEYIEREQSANDPARKEELMDIIKKIDKEIETIKENRKAIQNAIMLDTGEEVSREKDTKEEAAKAAEEKKALDDKIAAMKQKEAQKRAKEVEQMAARTAPQGSEPAAATTSNTAGTQSAGASTATAQAAQTPGGNGQTAANAGGTPPTADEIQFQKAAKEFNAGNYQKAMAMFEDLAKKGDAHAQYTVGGMYLYAKDIPTDWDRGVFWLKKSADQGYTMAQYQYGAAHISAAQGDRKMLNEGFKYLTLAADKDDQSAMKEYVNAVLAGYTKKSQITQAKKYCKRLKQISQDPYEVHQCGELIKQLRKIKKKRSGGRKRSGSCLGRLIKWSIIIGLIWSILMPQLLDYVEKSRNANSSSNTSKQQEEVETVKFGDEIIEAHSMTPVESDLITLKSEHGYVIEDSLWDGSFLYRAGNGKDTAYAIYELGGLFETLTLEATPYIGTGNFYNSSSADIMILNSDTNEVLKTLTVKHDSGILELQVDVSGINRLGIYVKKTSSGLGDLAYVFVRNVYLYPVGQSPESTVSVVYSIDGNIRANAGKEYDVLLVADGEDFVATGVTTETSGGAVWHEVYIDDARTQTGWAHSSIITQK